MTAVARVQDALRDRGMKGRGKAWQCPAHDDRSPSLSVDHGDERALVHCHAGCELDDVLAALDLTPPDLFDNPREKRVHGPLGDPVTSYAYEDADGVVRYYVDRYMPKTFRPRMADGSKGFPREARILYRLPAVLAAAAAGGTVFVCEGEKDVDNLVRETGATATTMPGGTGMGWLDSYSAALKGAGDVVIIADRDEPGRQHAAKVSASLLGYDIPHRILEPAAGKDMSDHLAAGLGYEDLRPTNPKTPEGAHDADTDGGSGISGTRSGDAGWEEPVPLDSPTLPAFPVDSLGALAPFVTATAASLQVPADMVAFACLATISTTTGGRRKVQVKHGWNEATALYLTALADSSEKKTPALNAACDALRDIETELIEQARPDVEATAQEIRITTSAMEKAEKAAGSGDDNAKADAQAARKKLLELGDAPALPLILVRDITLEALALRMAEQKGRLGSLASEGGLFKTAAGLYGNNGKANTDLLLEAYTGGPYSIERIGRPDRRMPSTFLALGMIIQPGMVAGLEKKNPEFRQSGFLARFLYSKPAPTESDTFDTPEVPFEVSDDYGQRIRALVSKVWNTQDVVMMRLSEGARRAFGEFYDAFAKRRKPGGDLHDIADWAGKLRGQLVRIAACLTLYEDPHAQEISHTRMSAAISMAPYFIAHARAVFDLMGKNREGALKPLRDVLAWLRDRPEPSRDFSARDAWQALKGREWAEDMDAMNDVLHELEDYGWIALIPREDTPGKRGRKPSPKYAVHPHIEETR